MCTCMRQISAHFALAGICATLLAPLAVAAQESPMHACCLRAGAHRCKGGSHEAGFHSKASVCPYSASLPRTAAFALEIARFSIGSPDTFSVVSQSKYQSPSAAGRQPFSARAPPLDLLQIPNRLFGDAGAYARAQRGELMTSKTAALLFILLWAATAAAT